MVVTDHEGALDEATEVTAVATASNDGKVAEATALTLPPGSLFDDSVCKGLAKLDWQDEPERSHQKWQRYLRERQAPPQIVKLSSRAEPLLWCAPAEVLNSHVVVSLTKALNQGLAQGETKGNELRPKTRLARQVAAFVNDRPRSELNSGSSLVMAYEALAIARRLQELVAVVDAATWWQCLNLLLDFVRDSKAIDLQTDPLAALILAGELPLTLAIHLPELLVCAELAAQGREVVSQIVETHFDGAGMIHGEQWSLQRPITASLTRVALLQNGVSGGVWDAAAAEEYPLIVRELLRSARRDESQILLHEVNPEMDLNQDSHPDANAGFFTALTRTCLKIVSDPRKPLQGSKPPRAAKSAGQTSSQHADLNGQATDNHRSASDTSGFASSTISNSSPGGAKNLNKALQQPCDDEADKPLPPNWPSIYSEWSQVALLRPSWKKRGPRFGLRFAGQRVLAELSVGRDLLLAGEWEYQLTMDGQALEPTNEWREVCWVSDADVDYLEIELEFGGGLKLQRQIALARKDAFLFLADAVIGQSPGRLSARQRLPFTNGARGDLFTETREVRLTASKPRCWVLPLALPEWRSDPRGGALTADENGLELRSDAVGQSLFSPLWIDLDPERLTEQMTWRQLTVAETRRICARDAAVGYRVQIGARQWLIYRSLGRTANRTILGNNLSTDFLIARFSRKGQVTSVIEVE